VTSEPHVTSRVALFILTLCLAAVITLVPGSRPVPAAYAQGQAQLEPLDYFRVMMPVLTHPRCINCHGKVDPSDSLRHEGGSIDTAMSCTSSCHHQADNDNQRREDDWNLAPSVVWFVKPSATGALVNKTDRELCEQMADRVANRGAAEFRHHLADDIPIDLGFQGKSGGARDSSAAPPPMSKDKFRQAADHWLDDGFGVCEREGTIIRTEEINSDRTYPPTDPVAQGQEVRVKQSGRRTVTVRFANGRYEANVEVKGTVTTTQTIRAETDRGPCTTIITGSYNYTEVDDPSPGLFPGQSGRASVEVKLEPSGEYTVTVHLGEEKHRSVESTTLQDGCGIGLRAPPPETLETVWSPSRFLFRGKLTNPRDRTRLGGRELHVWFERAPSSDEDPWLPDHHAVMALDGTIHPVDIMTTWNIRYLPR
jgi:hypothetical protein